MTLTARNRHTPVFITEEKNKSFNVQKETLYAVAYKGSRMTGLQQTPVALFKPASPDFASPREEESHGGVGLVLGQDVAYETENKIFSPIIVEALVPGDVHGTLIKLQYTV